VKFISSNITVLILRELENDPIDKNERDGEDGDEQEVSESELDNIVIFL